MAGGVDEIRVVNVTSPGPCGSDPIFRIEVFVYLGYVPVLTATFILGNHHGTCVHATLMAPQLANGVFRLRIQLDTGDKDTILQCWCIWVCICYR